MGIGLYALRPLIENDVAPMMEWLGFDYYVTDENLLRIAGTGTYKKFVGFNLPFGSATEYVMRTQEIFVMQEPFSHEICKACPAQCSCLGESMIIYPILMGGESIGTIAIGAFDEEKKAILKSNEGKILKYVKTMTEFIVAKVGEMKLNTRMRAVMDNTSEGIVLTDGVGRILYKNKVSTDLFLLGNREINHINDMLPDYDMGKLVNKQEIQEKGEYKLCINYVDKKIYMDVKSLEPDEINSEILFLFNTESKLRTSEGTIHAEADVSSDVISGIIGNGNQINRVKNFIISASQHDSNVLIRGESGTGKELFARAIHQLSVRKNEPFVAVNCAAIPEHLLESELFGYEAGAFTGAQKSGKKGKFELANKGTLFLDEIGDMAVHLQPKLLRAIEYGEIEKVGGTAAVSLNLRIIAATNRNLEEMVKEGKFREDLYYRLNVIPIFIPPLRSRREDILTLARFFLGRYNNRFSKRIVDFTEQVERELLLYDWPGNVRELENAIECAVLTERTERITLSSLSDKVKIHGGSNSKASKIASVRELESNLIEQLAEKHGLSSEGKRKIALEMGISLSTLYRRLRSN